jgi:hypothetical protein
MLAAVEAAKEAVVMERKNVTTRKLLQLFDLRRKQRER